MAQRALTAAGLEPDLVERVLERLGFARPPHPHYPGLAALYDAWCRHVPFDNIRKRIHLTSGAPGPLPGDRPQDFLAAWLRDGTGATCWAGNGALQAFLSGLGFAARHGLATMMAAPDLPPNHGTVAVDLDGQVYLVDASILFGEPLLLLPDEATRVDHRAWGVQCLPQGRKPRVRWRPFNMESLDCRLDDLETTAQEFRAYHEATRQWSPFNYELSIRLNRGNSVIGVGFGQRAEIDGQGNRTLSPLVGQERLRFLVEEVGIREEIAQALPDDEATPSPSQV